MNETIIEPDSPEIPSYSGKFKEYELPGYLPITIKTRENITRVDYPFSEKKASIEEFTLAPSTDQETYHYAILYKNLNTHLDHSDNAMIKPIGVLELDTRSLYQVEDNTQDVDLTEDMKLAVKKVYASKDLEEELKENLKTVADFKNFLNSLTVLFVMNFDRSIVSFTDNDQEKYSSTKDYLLDFEVPHLLRIQTNDYKIRANDFEGKEKDYFVMTSSMYVDTNGDWGKKPATTIDSQWIYFTEDAALNGNPAISGLVERLAVKYELEPTYISEGSKYLKIYEPAGNSEIYKTVNLFKLGSTTGSYDFSTIPVTWSAEVVGYGMNALEPEEKLFKQIIWGIKDNPYTWNDPDNKRSYWSSDVHYTINVSDKTDKHSYPQQYRIALESDTTIYYQINGQSGITTTNDNFYLKYFSYNQLKTDLSKEIYSLENTYEEANTNIEYDKDYYFYRAKGLGPFNYYSAGTHYILTCVLRLDNNTPKDLYRDDDDVYYDSKSDLLTAKLTLLNYRDLIGGASDMRVLNVDWEKGLGYTESGTDHYDDLRTLSWGVDALLYINDNGTYRMAEITDLDVVPAMISGGDGQVMIAPKSDRRDKFYLYYKDEVTEKNSDSGMIEDTQHQGMYWHPISYNKLVSLFHKTMGTFDYFNQGRMYYCAPVTHFVSQIGPDSWKTVGDVGAVRNNWYKINVLGVKAPGRSVAVADQPIIPMLDNKRDYLTSQMIIFRWHEINSGVSQYPNGDF